MPGSHSGFSLNTLGAASVSRDVGLHWHMPDEPKPFNVRTNAEWQKLGCTAESRTYFDIDAEAVPEQFRPLIPYAVRWAIDCDVRRGDYFDKQPSKDIEEFYAAVT